MNYRESRRYLNETAKLGSVLGLDTMNELMKRLGNAENSCPAVHVAGTNGKGSVMAFLYSVLVRAGYNTGRYNSPAVFCYRERWGINGEMISREEFASCVEAAAEAAEGMQRDGFPHPTVFEIETAAAFLWFARRHCGIVLIEVGMGGNLDATNVIQKPILSIITSIGMDHTEYLGSTIPEIAEKKAGIIKPGCMAVSARQEPGAEMVIREACRSCGIPFITADPDEALILEEGSEGQRFSWHGEEYRIPLSGMHQIQNAVLALKALDILSGLGFPVPEPCRKQGLASAGWDGRFTYLLKDPVFIADGAHNPPAAQMLAATLEKYYPDKAGRFIFIIGMFRDKDYREVLRITCPLAGTIFTIETPGSKRALPAGELCEAAMEYSTNGRVTAMKSIEEAVRCAMNIASSGDVIVTFGSLSFLSAVRRIIETEHY